MLTIVSGRRSVAAMLPIAGLVAALAGCGADSAKGLPPAPGAAGPPGDYQRVIDSAPVAPASAIPSGSLMAKIKSRGTLIVGGTDTAALFSLKDPVSGKTTGFDAALSAMLAKYITGKPNTKLVQVTVNTREALLQNGTVDAVFATYTITPERAKKIAFAGPYYSSGEAILVKKGNTRITRPADLNGRTVCTESSSVAADDVKKVAPSAKIILFEQNSQCVQAVEDGRADAYVLDQAILLGDAYRDPKVKVVGQPFTSEPYGIGLPKASPEMKSFVDDWLKLIQSNGTWAKLWHATIGTAVGGNPPAPPAIGSVAGS
ncbi:glutamate ABC transporter substrate-binding protein [Actinoallomurus spadix]|uniref:Glutamate ABC transporter substrate-binding protein n=1 Tax=Actinoallomurus spadix TaxID=79912 RepID=A0ABP3HIJ1_9ACTN|nr:glutamate ABC transporter substrate-binding protein [Actinoallomurus spadix]MCO5988453.1 glutamate ABC transporter substrate-binding protein [Actinoallomurus spadix]